MFEGEKFHKFCGFIKLHAKDYSTKSSHEIVWRMELKAKGFHTFSFHIIQL